MPEMTSKELAAFGPYEFYPEDTDKIDLQIVMMPKRPGSLSVYLVFARPKNAKEHINHGGTNVYDYWPEVCIALLSEVPSEDNHGAKEWDVYPILRRVPGWRKRPVARIVGRAQAALEAMAWLARENKERADPRARRAHKQRAHHHLKEVDNHAEAIATFEAYMMTFDNFSSDSREVGESMGISHVIAFNIGQRLAEAGLIQIEPFEMRGGMRVSGGGIKKSRGVRGSYEPDTWQCLETYDNIDRAQAIDLFIEKLPGVANICSKHIADEMRKTRAEAAKQKIERKRKGAGA